MRKPARQLKSPGWNHLLLGYLCGFLLNTVVINYEDRLSTKPILDLLLQMYADLGLRRADIGVLDSIPDRVLVVPNIRPVLNINDGAYAVGLSR